MTELDNNSDLDAGEEFSLADLAELDVSDIAEVRFESLPGGMYLFRGESAKLEDTTNAEGERRFVATFKMEVTEVKMLTERKDSGGNAIVPEDVIGKKHTEKQYIVPIKAAEGIGLLRSFLGDIGLPNAGPLGGVEGKPEGIIDGFVGHEFSGKIIKQARKNDPSQKDARLRIDPPKKTR